MTSLLSSPRRRRLLLAAGTLFAGLVVAALVLPFVVDVNRFRPAIEEAAEGALGRDVRLGPMRLSLLPLGVEVQDLGIAALPGEGGGDLLTARRLKVGARLLPLLRRRLEVTTLSVDGARLALERGRDGTWNIERLLPPEGEAPPASGPEPTGFTLQRLRLTDGQVQLALRGPGPERTLTITGLDLRVSDLAADRPMSLRLAATIAEMPGASVGFRGSVGPLAPAAGGRVAVDGTLEAREVSPEAVLGWAAALGAPTLPAGLVGARPASLVVSVAAEYESASAGMRLRSAAIRRAEVRGLDLVLERRRDGTWNWETLAGPPAAGGPQEAPAPQLSLADVELADLRIRVRDHAAGEAELVLDPFHLSLDRLPTEAAATLHLELEVEAAGSRGSLALRGGIGPLAHAVDSLPADLRLQVGKLPLAAASPYLRDWVALEPTAGTLSADLRLDGDLLASGDVKGSVELRGATVWLADPAGGPPRALPVDLEARLDLGIEAAGRRLQGRTVDLTVGGNELHLRGTLDRREDPPLLDAEVALSRVNAEDLTALLALLGAPLPVSMASREPVEIEARVQGRLGGGALPRMEGRIRLRGFTVQHPSLAAPVEEVGAVLSLQGERVEIRDLSARVGASDLAGEASLEGFDAPRIRFDLRSRQADFQELLSFLGTTAPAESPEGPPTGGEADGLAGLSADGTLRIDRGSLGGLRFSDLQAGLRLEGGQLTLDPFRMALYEGSFDGSAALDLAGGTPAFRVQAGMQAVRGGPLLAEALQAGDLLDGRIQAGLDMRGTGAGFEPVVRGLAGGGTLQVTEGRVGALDMLDILSQVSGVFGEDSLQGLSRKLQQRGTEFSRLAGTVRLDGGRVRSDDLVLESEDLTLRGKGSLDLLAATLDGTFQVIFSDSLSRSMRQEGSRAAQAFWDPGLDRVNLPLKLSGPLASPTPNVDWGAAGRNLATRKATEELRERLGDRLGGLLGGGSPAAAPVQPTQPPDAGPPPPPPGALGAEITRTRWSGSFLLRDLKIEGVIRGSGIASAAVVITDAGGRELRRVDPLDEVETYFAGGADRTAPATIRWDTTVDGKAIATARPPFTVVVKVRGQDGGSAEARAEVDR